MKKIRFLIDEDTPHASRKIKTGKIAISSFELL